MFSCAKKRVKSSLPNRLNDKTGSLSGSPVFFKQSFNAVKYQNKEEAYQAEEEIKHYGGGSFDQSQTYRGIDRVR
jgi:hypothetical protein